MRRLILAACCLFVFLWMLLPFAGADTLIHFTSDPGTGFGQKDDVTLSAATGTTFQLQRGFGGSIQIDAYSGENSQLACGSEFAAPNGSLLAVGTYSDTVSGVSDTNPRLTFYDLNVQTAGSAGKFQVLDVTYDASGNVLTFAADFVQSNPDNHAVCHGQVRYHSSVPYLVPGGTVDWVDAADRISEKAGNLTVSVHRNGGSAGPLSAAYATADGTDLAGRDYTAVSGTLSWADGDDTDRTLTIPILNSGDPAQGDGTFTINLSGAGIGLQSQDTVTVVNDNSALTFVHYVTDPDPTTGKAAERTFSLDTGYVISVKQYGGQATFSFDNQAAAGNADFQVWSLVLSSPLGPVVPAGTTLGVGDYEDAVRIPMYAGQPGLDFSGDSSGPNTVTGNFQVLEAEYDDAGNVLKFAANFVQYDDGRAQAVRGEVRYHSTVPLPVVTPQVSVSAASSYLVIGSDEPGVFTIVRTGSMASPLTVSYQLSGRTAHGRSGPALTETATIKAGKSRARVKVLSAATAAAYGKLIFKLTISPPADGSYTVASPGAAKVKFYP